MAVRRCAQCRQAYNDTDPAHRELFILTRLTAANRGLCATCARRPDPAVRSPATEAVHRFLRLRRRPPAA